MRLNHHFCMVTEISVNSPQNFWSTPKGWSLVMFASPDSFIDTYPNLTWRSGNGVEGCREKFVQGDERNRGPWSILWQNWEYLGYFMGYVANQWNIWCGKFDKPIKCVWCKNVEIHGNPMGIPPMHVLVSPSTSIFRCGNTGKTPESANSVHVLKVFPRSINQKWRILW